MLVIALIAAVAIVHASRHGGRAAAAPAGGTSATALPVPAALTPMAAALRPSTSAPPPPVETATPTPEQTTEAPPSTPPAPAPEQTTEAPPTTQAPAAPDTPTPQERTGPIGVALPLEYDGGAAQVVTVVASSSGSTQARVTGWNREDDGSWSVAVGPYTAWIGAQGIGGASESASRTPSGTYTLTQAFGRRADPGTALPYFQTGPDDWWDENPDSPTYNQHVVQAASPGGDSENLYTTGSAYDYAINIDYNLAGVPGAGSAFFIHVSTGSPTAGCVAIPASGMLALLGWLDPGASPVAVLGVG